LEKIVPRFAMNLAELVEQRVLEQQRSHSLVLEHPQIASRRLTTQARAESLNFFVAGLVHITASRHANGSPGLLTTCKSHAALANPTPP